VAGGLLIVISFRMMPDERTVGNMDHDMKLAKRSAVDC
jgi:hypothetical protein